MYGLGAVFLKIRFVQGVMNILLPCIILSCGDYRSTRGIFFLHMFFLSFSIYALISSHPPNHPSPYWIFSIHEWHRSCLCCFPTSCHFHLEKDTHFPLTMHLFIYYIHTRYTSGDNTLSIVTSSCITYESKQGKLGASWMMSRDQYRRLRTHSG